MKNDTGAERLRRIVSAMNMTREWALDGFTPAELVNLIEACWASPWDILPDDLQPDERTYAAKHGKLHKRCLQRLDRTYGYSEPECKVAP